MTEKLDVLDKGYVRLVRVYGDDLEIVNDARVSFDKESEWGLQPTETTPGVLNAADGGLIKFLARHEHWSPFSHSFVKFEVKAPMMVVDQWKQSRAGMRYTDEEFEDDAWNQKSMRYVSPDDFYIPTVWRSAPENKKQGSGPPVLNALSNLESHRLLDVVGAGVEQYNHALARGIAPEQARLFLPMYAMYTKFRWTASIYALVRFLKLRRPDDAQWEIRQYGDVVQQLVQPHFPYTFRAFGLELPE